MTSTPSVVSRRIRRRFFEACVPRFVAPVFSEAGVGAVGLGGACGHLCEVTLIVADLIRTVTVDLTLTNVAVLGVIVIIRTFLSMSLEIEISGASVRGREFQSLVKINRLVREGLCTNRGFTVFVQ